MIVNVLVVAVSFVVAVLVFLLLGLKLDKSHDLELSGCCDYALHIHI